MSIFNSKEKTYKFSLEGLALAKADSNKRNLLSDYNSILFITTLGISVAGACLICSPLSSMVAFKCIEAETISKVAFKAISTIL